MDREEVGRLGPRSLSTGFANTVAYSESGGFLPSLGADGCAARCAESQRLSAHQAAKRQPQLNENIDLL